MFECLPARFHGIMKQRGIWSRNCYKDRSFCVLTLDCSSSYSKLRWFKQCPLLDKLLPSRIAYVHLSKKRRGRRYCFGWIEPFKFSSKLAISYRVRVYGNDYNALAFVLRFALSAAATVVCDITTPSAFAICTVKRSLSHHKKRTSTFFVCLFLILGGYNARVIIAVAVKCSSFAVRHQPRTPTVAWWRARSSWRVMTS